MSSATIVFIHKGYSSCLFASILTARKSNPNSEIFLIGDKENHNVELLELADCKHIEILDYMKSARDFSEIYRHDGNNPVEYELFCIQRWFILQDFLVEQNRQVKVLYLDSDAFLYDQADSIFSTLGSKISLPQKISPAFTYIGSLTELKNFCRFISESYGDDKAYKKLGRFVANFSNKGMPHISDMTLFGEYANVKGKLIIEDLRVICEKRNFYCDNFSYSQGMKMGIIGKKVTKNEKDERFFLRNSDMTKIPVGGLHFQGLMKTTWLIYADKKDKWKIIREEIKSGNFKLSKYLKFFIYIFISLITRPKYE
jgi:hypothetical protein